MIARRRGNADVDCELMDFSSFKLGQNGRMWVLEHTDILPSAQTGSHVQKEAECPMAESAYSAMNPDDVLIYN
jgi:hypothetical protein